MPQSWQTYLLPLEGNRTLPLSCPQTLAWKFWKGYKRRKFWLGRKPKGIKPKIIKEYGCWGIELNFKRLEDEGN